VNSGHWGDTVIKASVSSRLARSLSLLMPQSNHQNSGRLNDKLPPPCQQQQQQLQQQQQQQLRRRPINDRTLLVTAPV